MVDLDIPEDDPKAAAAAVVVRSFLEKREATYTGGCRAFYSPREWAARCEQYGLNSVLVICHDGGSVGQFFSYDQEDYDAIEAMSEELRQHGLYAEQCTTWYSALYPCVPQAPRLT